VYSAAINQLWAEDKIKLIVIVNQTEKHLRLKPAFTLSKSYVLAGKEELDSLLYNADRQAFTRQYPDSPGYIILSEINYNDEATEAMLGIDQECGFLCGVGWYLRLSKKDGRWVVKEKEITWQK
jgi:hypothetical protein